MTYRCTITITDESTGDVIERDWCTITDARIGEFGDCEPVDQMTGKMLRNWKRFARAEYEATLDRPANEYVHDDAQFGVGA